MHKITLPRLILIMAAALALAACSPKLNWRDYRSPDAPFTVMFPDKPITQSRTIELGEEHVSMLMTAAKVDGIVFAVGSAELADPTRAQLALPNMKTAMLRNLNATVRHEANNNGVLEVDAIGNQNGAPMQLTGHFQAQGKRVYQVIVIGPEKVTQREAIETFMSSFKLN